jgi:protein-L-isoaspartate(D-aspartate) O-methyltransferase
MARLAILTIVAAAACGHRGGREAVRDAPPRDIHAQRRAALVEQLAGAGVRDRAVLDAIGRVPRHELVPAALVDAAYDDMPLPIGEDQTISQPWVVARMTELADVERGDKVLEIGTGSGYQAAVLAELGADVYTIEIVEPLARRARADLDRLGYTRIHTRTGDGYVGWPEAAPFAAVLLTAAPPDIPQPLLDQLALGGRLVAPVGDADTVQDLVLVTRTADGYHREVVDKVLFVPMTGSAQSQ